MGLNIIWKCLTFHIVQYISAQETYGSNDIDYYFNEYMQCPPHWVQFQFSCYRFIKSPLRSYNESRKICQVSNIITIN